MVKKRLLSGEPCRKCAQAEEMLRNRGLWQRVDEVVWAEEGNPDSAGGKLADQYDVEIAPFFLVEKDGEVVLYKSAIKFMKELVTAGATTGTQKPELEVSQRQPEDWEAMASALDGQAPRKILEAALSQFGEACAISFSGAEDVVLLDMATKLGRPFSVFSLDTGRLHPETYRFIDRVRQHYGLEIQLLSSDPKRLEPFVRQKGLFSFYEDGHKECCAIRKVEPLRRGLRQFASWVTGQRKDQSVTRADLDVVQLDSAFEGASGPLVKWNPLANWSSKDVWDYIRANDVPYNELHDHGFLSIGCEPCSRAVRPGEHERAGRWWWEEETKRECGLHRPKP